MRKSLAYPKNSLQALKLSFYKFYLNGLITSKKKPLARGVRVRIIFIDKISAFFKSVDYDKNENMGGNLRPTKN
jgi:hypothetical protein